jgi:hypothetical protein
MDLEKLTPERLAILEILRAGPPEGTRTSVIATQVHRAQSTVSTLLARLRDAGLCTSPTYGHWIAIDSSVESSVESTERNKRESKPGILASVFGKLSKTAPRPRAEAKYNEAGLRKPAPVSPPLRPPKPPLSEHARIRAEIKAMLDSGKLEGMGSYLREIPWILTQGNSEQLKLLDQNIKAYLARK